MLYPVSLSGPNDAGQDRRHHGGNAFVLWIALAPCSITWESCSAPVLAGIHCADAILPGEAWTNLQMGLLSGLPRSPAATWLYANILLTGGESFRLLPQGVRHRVAGR